MKRFSLLLTVSLLAACNSANQSPPADQNATAASDAGNIAPADTTTSAIPTGTPTPPAAATTSPVANSAAPADSAEAAADVVRHYFALIGAGKYRDAWALWDIGGKASGMSADAFAASFAKYASFKADVGAPGDVDAGAGQRYVTVPVVVSGTLKSGGGFRMEGPVTLHRVGDIDGATPAQKRWHIRSTDLKPRPDASGGRPAHVTVRFRCIDGSHLRAEFDNEASQVTLSRGGRPIVTLDQQVSGSGIWYKGGGYEFRGKGDAMTFTAPGQPPLPCTAAR